MTDNLIDRIQRLLASNDLDQARTLLERMRSDAPESIETLRAAAYVDFADGEDDAALGHLERAVEAEPGNDALRQEYAELLASAGYRDDAIAQLRLLPVEGRHWQRAFILGRLLYESGREEQASHAFEQALRSGAPEAVVRRALAESLFAAEKYDAALPHFDALGGASAADVDLFLRRMQCRVRSGDVDGSARLLDSAPHAIASDPRLALARGRLEEDRGDADAARRAYRTAASAAPNWPEPVAALLMLDHRAPERALVDLAAEMANEPSLHPQDQAYLHYALGKVASTQGRHDDAWAHWSAANAIRRSESPAEDPDALARRVDLLRDLYRPELVSHMRAQVAPDTRPVLIVGMPRSGTTLVEQILASHPQVHGAGELPTLAQIHEAVAAGLATGAEPDFAVLARDYIGRLARNAPGDATRLVDKQPYNFFFLGLAAGLMPGMRVIWCRRDPRDVAVSIFGENFSSRSRYATDAADIRALQQAQDALMAHWRTTLAVDMLEVRYEDLVRDFETTVREMIGFLELPWDAGCLHFHETRRAVQTNSRWQVRERLHSRSVGRWRAYAAPLAAAGFDVDDVD